jgi:malonate decarboxylase beta subunit
MPTPYRLPITSLRPLAPIDRIAAIADANSIDAVVAALASPRPSPHLARWGIIARDDDGIVVARLRVHGRPVLAAAQDVRFLGGSVGAKHGEALALLFEQARTERPAAVVLLLASGGVRLHEANPAELALARALRGLLDTRVAGIPVLTLAVGDVFGGASVVACASDRLALLPETRLGLSGPKVIEMVHGRDELEADDADDVDKLFGEKARAAAGQVELLVDDIEAIRSWIALAARTQRSFDVEVLAMHARLGARLAAAESNATARNPPATGQRLPVFVDATRRHGTGARDYSSIAMLSTRDSARDYSSIATPSIRAVGCGRFAAGRSGSLVQPVRPRLGRDRRTPSILHSSRISRAINPNKRKR